jgi:hypothetical protein
LLALLSLSVLASAVFAQALDTPTLHVNRVGFYRIDLDVQAGASGAPNGFVIQWMKKSDFDAFGWPADEYDPRAAYCDFIGEPTLNIDPRSSTFELAPNGAIEVQMGDLADETGVDGSYLDQMIPGYYVFRAWAEGNGTVGSESAKSSPIFAATSNPECTQGFWKNHPEVWPPSCLPMLLGTVSYTKPQLLAIFGQPVGGNGLISLAHQLIATKLNLCNGSSPTNIAATVAAADAMIGGLVVPPVGAGSLSPGATSSLTNTLDNWNNGIVPGVVNCPGSVPTTHSTWGRVKSLYR